jgi:succinoglycan biosynthesis transport protein ExoP
VSEFPHNPARPALATRPGGVPSCALHQALRTTPMYAGSSEKSGPPMPYHQVLWKWKLLIVFVTVIGGVSAYLLARRDPPMYRSRATVELQLLNQNFMNARETNPIAIYSGEGGIQTQIRILQSSSLLRRAVAKIDPEFGRKEARPSASLEVDNQTTATQNASPKQIAIATAAATFSARAYGLTNIIELSSDSTDPVIAAKFLDALANEYIEQNIESRWESAQRTSVWLSKQIAELKADLEKSERSLQTHVQSNGLIVASQRESLAEEKLRRIQQDLTVAQAETVAKRSTYELVNDLGAGGEGVSDLVNDPVSREYQGKLTDLRRQLAELSASYTPDHYRVRRAQAEIAALEAANSNQRNQLVSRIHNEYQQARRREDLLSAAYARQAQTVSEQSGGTIAFNTLKQEVDSNRQLYDSMRQRLREANIGSALRASNIRVVDPAEPPSAPYRPRPVLNGMLGSMIGLFGAAGAVLARARLNSTLQSPNETAFVLNLTELSVIPTVKGAPILSPRALKDALGSREEKDFQPLYTTSVKDRALNSRREVGLKTFTDKSSVIADSFRTALVSLLFSDRNGPSPRVIAVTSPGAREGKTIVTTNLGIAMAEINKHVLVIEADTRRPSLHKVFGMSNKTGLSTLLNSSSSVKDLVLKDVILESHIPGLDVLPLGPGGLEVWRLLCSPRMHELMMRFRVEYDFVLIDTVPVLAGPDARIMTRLADGAVLVVRAGVSRRDEARAALQRFFEDDTRALGTILNDWKPSTGSYRYSSYYSYPSQVSE